MIMTEYYSSTNYNKFDNFTVTDTFGNSYLFVRSLGKKMGFFNIAKCEVVAKDKCIPKGHVGIIPDATWFSEEQVAELVSQEEECRQRLENAESSLRERIAFREIWAKTGRKSKQ